ncbi:hypothetical protein KAH81_05855 [bacterium]|nr:hypothetical protein [bacterium]
MEYWENIVAKCTRKGILLNTELLLLLCVGIYKRQLVESSKITNKYSVNDFNIVANIAAKFSPLYVSPQVLAEFSNYSDRLGSKVMREFYSSIEKILKGQFEVHIPKDVMIDENYLPVLGFTDVSMMKICEEKGCVLFTADLQLESIYSKRIDVVNFNHIRSAEWF